MQLSDYQKLIINKILTEEIVDLYSFVTPAGVKLWGGGHPKATFSIYTDYTVGPQDFIHRPINEEEAYRQFKEFIALWDYLERLGLIKTLSVKQPPVRILNIFRADFTPNYEIISLIYPYFNKEIAVLPPIKDFVERGFITDEEYDRQRNERNQSKSLRLTRRVAYISLGVSILVAVGTLIFNYLTYTTQRNVTIANPNAFRDTTKILLLNQQPNITSDSLSKDQLKSSNGKIKSKIQTDTKKEKP